MEFSLEYAQSVIRQLRKTEQTFDVKHFLDDFVLYLNHHPNDGMHVLTTIGWELADISILKHFHNPEIMNHKFIHMIRSTFNMLFAKLTVAQLTKEDEQSIDALSLLMSALCLYKNKIVTNFYVDNNENLNPENKEKLELISYEKIFFTEQVFKKISRILEDDMSSNDYDEYHIKYKILGRLIHLFIKLTGLNYNLILDSVVRCLESTIYFDLYKNIDLRQVKLTPKQHFFMLECPKFIRLCSGKRNDEISISLSKLMIKNSFDIFESQFPIALRGNISIENADGAKIQALTWCIELLNHFALTPKTREYFLRRFDPNRTIVDLMIEIIQTESLIKSVEKNVQLFHPDVGLMSYALTLLYNLVFETKVLKDLKEKGVKTMCEALFRAKAETIQFPSRTLVAILDEEDIGDRNDPSKIVRNYLYFISHTIDELTLIYHGIKLDGVLTNLEAIVQNEKVKEEIINDDEGIPLIGRCAYTSHLDEETIRYPALKIIDSVTFAGEKALKKIKSNDSLMEYIRELQEKNNKLQEPVVNRLLWVLEGQAEFIAKQQILKRQRSRKARIFDEKKAIYQYIRGDHRFKIDEFIDTTYDIMISFCQDDKELCQKIHDRLNDLELFNIAFDKDNHFHTSPKLMAQAIEQSSLILIFVSSNYLNTNSCRLAVEFAQKRDRPIIVVKIDKKCDETKTWLSDKLKPTEETYVDFTERDFNQSLSILVEKIQFLLNVDNKNS